MSRVNDVGGQTGFGPVVVEEDEPVFHADWEARVYALHLVLLRRGAYTADELRDAVERMPPQEYLAASYYERWLHAIEELTAGAEGGGTASPAAPADASGSEAAGSAQGAPARAGRDGGDE